MMMRAKAAAIVELTKPRIALLVLVTAWVGAALAPGDAGAGRMAGVLAATYLLSSGALALNMVRERREDALMTRTASRPLPSGRLTVREALAAGWIATLAGLAGHLAWGTPLSAALGLLCWAIYLGVYTPMKKRSSASILVGAVSGALPPVMGWAGVSGRLGTVPLVLFAIMFLWQLPHFLAIAWVYREEYARAGFKMLPEFGGDTWRLVLQIGAATGALLMASLIPASLGRTGPLYLWAAVLGGQALAIAVIAFCRDLSAPSARRLFAASIAYLPVLLGALAVSSPAR